jgi:hypothetical protein
LAPMKKRQSFCYPTVQGNCRQEYIKRLMLNRNSDERG